MKLKNKTQVENAEKKEEEKRNFIKCKEKCVCTENTCRAIKFKGNAQNATIF